MLNRLTGGLRSASTGTYEVTRSNNTPGGELADRAFPESNYGSQVELVSCQPRPTAISPSTSQSTLGSASASESAQSQAEFQPSDPSVGALADRIRADIAADPELERELSLALVSQFGDRIDESRIAEVAATRARELAGLGIERAEWQNLTARAMRSDRWITLSDGCLRGGTPFALVGMAFDLVIGASLAKAGVPPVAISAIAGAVLATVDTIASTALAGIFNPAYLQREGRIDRSLLNIHPPPSGPPSSEAAALARALILPYLIRDGVRMGVGAATVLINPKFHAISQAVVTALGGMVAGATAEHTRWRREAHLGTASPGALLLREDGLRQIERLRDPNRVALRSLLVRPSIQGMASGLWNGISALAQPSEVIKVLSVTGIVAGSAILRELAIGSLHQQFGVTEKGDRLPPEGEVSVSIVNNLISMTMLTCILGAVSVIATSTDPAIERARRWFSGAPGAPGRPVPDQAPGSV